MICLRCFVLIKLYRKFWDINIVNVLLVGDVFIFVVKLILVKLFILLSVLVKVFGNFFFNVWLGISVDLDLYILFRVRENKKKFVEKNM